MTTAIEILHRNESLRLLPKDVLEEFASFSYRQTLKDGELFASRGEQAVGIVVVARGSICASSYNERGQQFAFSMIETGGVWGLVAVLETSNLMRESRAQGDTEVLILPRKNLLDTLSRRPELWRFFTQMLCRNLRRAHQVIDVIALLPLRERLARALYMNGYRLQRENATNGNIRVTLTQDDLAAMLVVSRHAVNRELKNLENDGLISTGYGYVELINLDGLNKLLGQQFSSA
jgi:CRP-like cAMP-binding protein